MISWLCWPGCFRSQIKCLQTHIEQRSLSARLQWVWKEFMHAQIIVFCIVGILSKTWTNVLYVLQIDTKTMLVIVVTITKVQQTGTKGRGRVPQWSHQTLLWAYPRSRGEFLQWLCGTSRLPT